MQRTGSESKQTGADERSSVRRSGISAHVLDTSRGRPAGNVRVKLFQRENERWLMLNECSTTSDGRCGDLLGNSRPSSLVGRYKIVFEVADYFAGHNIQSMYPMIAITFDINSADEHYHIPLLLSPFGFTTYRGS